MKKNILFIILMFSFIIKINATEKINYLESLSIENYELNFKKDVYEYDITIDEEEMLNINYELSDDNAYVSITGNGNFNSSENVIVINVNNDYKYKINVHKPIKVSYITNDEIIQEMSNHEKDILKLLIVTVSSIVVVYMSYLFFYKK
ncbi:MAG: hypothetical protein PUA90_03205 [bacterium]|nr:hypothetical protein [bacterium]